MPPLNGSPWPSRRIPRGVTYALNYNLVPQDQVKDEIGIGEYGYPPKATLADPASRKWMRRDRLDDDMDATLDVTSTQRRSSRNARGVYWTFTNRALPKKPG